MVRETFNLEKQIPSVHLDSLEKYLQISSRLVPDGEALVRPIIRHPDLRPSNILVSDDYEVTSLIDWQYATVLPPFLQSGNPDDLDNSGTVSSPETPRLPNDKSVLDEDSRPKQLEHLNHLYLAETSKNNPTHYEALTLPFVQLEDARSTI